MKDKALGIIYKPKESDDEEFYHLSEFEDLLTMAFEGKLLEDIALVYTKVLIPNRPIAATILIQKDMLSQPAVKDLIRIELERSMILGKSIPSMNIFLSLCLRVKLTFTGNIR